MILCRCAIANDKICPSHVSINIDSPYSRCILGGRAAAKAHLLRPLDEVLLVLLDERGDGDPDLLGVRVALLDGDVDREAVVEGEPLRPRADLVELDARELLPVSAVLREERL